MTSSDIAWSYVSSYILRGDKQNFISLLDDEIDVSLCRNGSTKTHVDLKFFLDWLDSHFHMWLSGKIISLTMDCHDTNMVTICLLSEIVYDIPPGYEDFLPGETRSRVFDKISLTCNPETRKITKIKHNYKSYLIPS